MLSKVKITLILLFFVKTSSVKSLCFKFTLPESRPGEISNLAHRYDPRPDEKIKKLRKDWSQEQNSVWWILVWGLCTVIYIFILGICDDAKMIYNPRGYCFWSSDVYGTYGSRQQSDGWCHNLKGQLISINSWEKQEDLKAYVKGDLIMKWCWCWYSVINKWNILID